MHCTKFNFSFKNLWRGGQETFITCDEGSSAGVGTVLPAGLFFVLLFLFFCGNVIEIARVSNFILNKQKTLNFLKSDWDKPIIFALTEFYQIRRNVLRAGNTAWRKFP
jgi:hypothetical protein